MDSRSSAVTTWTWTTSRFIPLDGLSYTTFEYSDIALSTPSMGQNSSITAVVTVTNTGKRDSAEVTAIHPRPCRSITALHPIRELKRL